MGKKDGRKGEKTRNYIDGVLGTSGLWTFTADKFLQIFNHYDKDGNRHLENKELDRFLKDFIDSSLVGLSKDNVTEEELQEMKKILLEEFDTNNDGKISCRELSVILPEKEAFFLLFKLDETQEFQNGIDYMKIWRKYDKDLSGFIEINELKEFLRDIITRVKRGVAPEDNRLNDYTKKIMDLFDESGDGKLSLSEMAKMLPTQENFVEQIVEKAMNLDRISDKDLKQLMDRYDANGDGFIAGSELSSLVRDIFAVSEPNGYFNASDVYELQQSILKGCDLNHDGRLDRRELQLVLQSTINQIKEDRKAGINRAAANERIRQGRKNQHIMSHVAVANAHK